MISPAENVQQILQSVRDTGVSIPSAGTDVDVPSDYSHIPNLGEGNIGDVMGRLASYISFLEWTVSMAETQHDSYVHFYEFEKKRLLLTLEPERKDIMEAKVETQLFEISRTTLQKYSEMKLLKALLEGKRRIFDSLSRELSRRSLVLQMQRGGIG